MTLDPAPRDSDLVAALTTLESGLGPAPFSVCDSWASLDLSASGYTVAERGLWLVRPPGSPPTRPLPADLVIERVVDAGGLQAFEAAAAEGFEHPEMLAGGAGSVHAPGVLDDENLHVFVGRVRNRAVSVAMAYVSHDIVGVYGVATVPGFRRRGYGEALTWDASCAAPGLPAMLQPSASGEATYRRMGYTPAGRFIRWLRQPAAGH
ncbi:hypothetical protein BH18ACT15_BH18ACT15_09270 [soil metagenome]